MAFLRFVNTSRTILFLLLTTLLISIELVVVRTSIFSRHTTILSLGVFFDLVFVTTGIFYWLVARPRRLANSRLMLVALLMVRVALFVLPDTAFASTKIWPALLILAEGAVLAIAVLRIRTITRTYRQLRTETDIETALRESLALVVSKRAAGAILGEGITLYYVLLGWRLKSDIPAGSHKLTTHRQSGQIALTMGLLFVGAIECVAVHLLLTSWYPTGAFWITAFSAYGMLFFIADIIATVKRPSYLTQRQLHLRLGIRWKAQITRSAIADVSLIYEKPLKQADRLNGAFLTAPNVLLTFHEPVAVEGPYGIQKTIRQLSFFVDDQAAFVRALNLPKA